MAFQLQFCLQRALQKHQLKDSTWTYVQLDEIKPHSIDGMEKGIATIPVFLPGKSHGQRDMAGYSPWGRKEFFGQDNASCCWDCVCDFATEHEHRWVNQVNEDSYALCSVTQSCLTLCNPMDCSTPGFPVLHYLPEFAQIHVCWVSDAVQPSHPLPPTFLNLFKHQGLFQWVSSSHPVAKGLDLQLEHQSFQRIFRALTQP